MTHDNDFAPTSGAPASAPVKDAVAGGSSAPSWPRDAALPADRATAALPSSVDHLADVGEMVGSRRGVGEGAVSFAGCLSEAPTLDGLRSLARVARWPARVL